MKRRTSVMTARAGNGERGRGKPKSPSCTRSASTAASREVDAGRRA